MSLSKKTLIQLHDKSFHKLYERNPARWNDIVTKARLAAEHITSLARIHVDTDANGVVYLSGTAQSQEAIDTAIRLTRDTEHVRGVHSDIALHDHD